LHDNPDLEAFLNSDAGRDETAEDDYEAEDNAMSEGENPQMQETAPNLEGEEEALDMERDGSSSELLLSRLSQRIIRHLTNTHIDREQHRSKAFNQGTIPIFNAILDVIGIDPAGTNPTAKPKKRRLFDAITKAVCILL
jgi:hypothetical protein